MAASCMQRQVEEEKSIAVYLIDVEDPRLHPVKVGNRLYLIDGS